MAQISIIVPVYNVEPFLHRCVDSIIAQRFHDFEVILIDDGSQDDSGRICDVYAESDSRIQVIHQRNGGLSAARNAGIDCACKCSKSEWLAFVDSDDWLHPEYLEYLYRAATENHVQISVCDYLETSTTLFAEGGPYQVESWEWDKLLMNNNVCAIVAWNKLYAKNLFFGIRYPPGRIHEDEFTTYKLLHRAGTVSYLPLPLYYYFQNENSITGAKFSLRRLDAADALQERIQYVRKLNNDQLTTFCVCQFLSYCLKIIPLLHGADWIPDHIRIKKEKEIQGRFKSVLAHYGMRYTPPNIYGGYYDYAFPVLYHTARRCARLIKIFLKAINIK